MRKFLLALLFCAVILHFLLHYVVQLSKQTWVPVVDQKEDTIIKSCINQNFQSILQIPEVYPFLCSDYLEKATEEGSKMIDLPYGIHNGDKLFRILFSKLKNCQLFPENNVPCKKCVVVGNGGILRNKTLGNKIDSYDVIIRMNDAPVNGFEDDVGRKTTFRLCYPESIFSNPLHYDPNTTLVLLAFKHQDVKWLIDLLLHRRTRVTGFWRKPTSKLIYGSEQIRILNPVILRKVAYGLLNFPKRFPKKETPKHPTTGIIGIAFALQICNEVHIAGFKYNLTSQNSSLHYYGNETMNEMSKNVYHNITTEQMLLKEFIDKKTIVNLTPD